MKKIGIICYPGFELQQMIDSVKFHDCEYKVIDFFSPYWLEQCSNDIDGYIVRPPCMYSEHKDVFDERLYILSNELHKIIYPSFKELYIYENKRLMHLYLKTKNLPHAETNIFLDRKSLISESHHFPLVIKSNIGAGGSCVEIVNSLKKLKSIARRTFGVHPDFSFGKIPFIKYKNIPIPRVGRSQKHYLITQKFLDIKVEWRMIRIGDYFMGHQKLLGENGFASGSELVGWERPSEELLSLVHDSTKKLGVDCMVLDIFETNNGEFYINELQSIIGAYRPYQMKVSDLPGRYILSGGSFNFEEGEHCHNSLWNLRVERLLFNLGK